MVTMEQVMEARDNWFSAQEIEQEARLNYIKMADEFMAQPRKSPAVLELNQKQSAAVDALISSFLDDDDTEDDDGAKHQAEGEVEFTDLSGMSDAEFHDVMAKEAPEVESDPEPEFEAAAEPAPVRRPSSLDRLRQAGRNENPLQK